MKAKPRLCLVEDDAIMGESLCDRFALEGFDCDWFTHAADAHSKIGSMRYAAIISDIRLPDMGGDELFQQVLARETYLPPWLFITAYGAVDRAVALLKLGAADYITKPFDLDQLIEKLKGLTLVPQRQCDPAPDTPRLGLSQAMRKIEAMLPRLAQQANTILLTGESGVGKEVVAREIHRLDPETVDQPFIAVNCGAITESLLETEIFGHEKGAFTGAARARKGVFEQADGGTLFLDEIGDMPLIMQVKLLRAIQERYVVRVGGERPVPVNLRLICATHRDLKTLVMEGSFREDLFYRIHVIHLKIPPVRDRKDDILWFANRFLEEFCAVHGTRGELSSEVQQMLFHHTWPGNLRELKHAIERACILSQGETLDPSCLFDETDPGTGEHANFAANLGQYLESCERNHILQALAKHTGHIGKTAASLGISRKNLWEKMNKLSIPR